MSIEYSSYPPLSGDRVEVTRVGYDQKARRRQALALRYAVHFLLHFRCLAILRRTSMTILFCLIQLALNLSTRRRIPEPAPAESPASDSPAADAERKETVYYKQRVAKGPDGRTTFLSFVLCVA